MDIVRDGELEATNYFFSLGEDENVLELTFNHDGRTYELGTAYGHIAIGVDDLDGTLEALRRSRGSSRSARPTRCARAARASASSAIRTTTGSSSSSDSSARATASSEAGALHGRAGASRPRGRGYAETTVEPRPERELKLAATPDFRMPSIYGLVGPTVRQAPPERNDTTYYDTADLRLARWGASLRHRPGRVGP